MSLDLTKHLQVRWPDGEVRPVTDLVLDGERVYVFTKQPKHPFTKLLHTFELSSPRNISVILENIPEKLVFESWALVVRNTLVTFESMEKAVTYRHQLGGCQPFLIRHEYTEGDGL